MSDGQLMVYELTTLFPGGYRSNKSLHATLKSAQEASKFLDLTEGQRVIITERPVLP